MDVRAESHSAHPAPSEIPTSRQLVAVIGSCGAWRSRLPWGREGDEGPKSDTQPPRQLERVKPGSPLALLAALVQIHHLVVRLRTGLVGKRSSKGQARPQCMHGMCNPAVEMRGGLLISISNLPN